MSKTNFSPSVNIIRDKNTPQSYIVTKNSKRTAKTIKNRFESNLHCFNIIGSYGTGKSSFILALENDLLGKKKHFFKENVEFNQQSKFEFINIIGSYTSIIELFGKAVNAEITSSSEEVLKSIDCYYNKLQRKDTFLFIIFDEYGKALEHAAKNNPEEKMYFMQQLAEYINNKNIILLTTLHQNFSQYGSGLSLHEKNEWKKVNGRFQEITFNEPIEQLLFLASDYVSKWNTKQDINRTIPINEIILNNKLVSNSLNFNLDFAKKIFPLDLISAYSLTKALQSYGQNERSLFTFLNLRSSDSLFAHAKASKNYTLEEVFDFIYHDFYGFLLSNDNPHKNAWSAIQVALEKSDSLIENNINETRFIIKTIGLLNIFANSGSPITKDFLIEYSKLSSYKITEDVILELERKKIIRFRQYSSRYILFEGTDLDFDKALKEAESKIPSDFSIVKYITDYYQLPFVCAKSSSYKTGTPRYFEYKISETPIQERPQGEIDGYINLIFSEENIKKEIKKVSKEDNAIIYALYKNSKKIKETLVEIEKTNIVLKEQLYDNVASKELNHMKQSLQIRLNKEIINNLTSDNIIWYCKGEKISISSQRQLNKELSTLCEKVYNKVPTFRNELINKHKVSVAIASARKNYIKAILNNSNTELVGFPEDKFPAEKTIYLSLLKETGIHQQDKFGNWFLNSPDNNTIGASFKALWNECLLFLKETEQEKTNLSQLYTRLSNQPFKLKEGFLSFWIPTFLIIQQDNFALFNKKGYIPFITEEVLELIHKKPKDFSIKAFSVAGIKLDLFNTYRKLINKELKEESNRNAYIETIRPLFKFYRELPTYTRNTNNLSSKSSSFRNAIAKAKDPESAFFESIPKALGYSGIDLRNENIDLENYLNILKTTIRELRDCEQDLYQRLERNILESLGLKNEKFSTYKESICKRFNDLDISFLNSDHRRLLSRLIVPIQKKNDWINGITSAILNKKISNFKDEDELAFSINFKKSIKTLEKLIPIHKLNKTRTNDKIIGFEILDIDGNAIKEQLSINHINKKELIHINKEMDSMLSALNKEEKKVILLQKLKKLCEYE